MKRAFFELGLIGLCSVAAVSMLPGALIFAVIGRFLSKQVHPEI